MFLHPIKSSSSGNCTLIYNKTTKILIDAGVPVKYVKTGVAKGTVDAIIPSHEHSDHVSNIGPMARYYECPIYVSKVIYELKKADLEGYKKLNFVKPGDVLNIGSLKVTLFSTKHDAKMSYGFFIEDAGDGSKLCLITDTGKISPLIESYARKANSLMIETDYDEDMLEAYPDYEDWLKQRIASDFGHLSNQQVVEFLATLDLSKYNHIVFSHLSERTNSQKQITKVAADSLDKTTMSKIHIAPLAEALDLKPIV